MISHILIMGAGKVLIAIFIGLLIVVAIIIAAGMYFGDNTLIKRPYGPTLSCLPGYAYDYETKKCVMPYKQAPVPSVAPQCANSDLQFNFNTNKCEAKRFHTTEYRFQCKSNETQVPTPPRYGSPFKLCRLPCLEAGGKLDPDNNAYCIGPGPKDQNDTVNFKCEAKGPYIQLRGGRCYKACPDGFAWSTSSGGVGICTRQKHSMDHKVCGDTQDYYETRCYKKCPKGYTIVDNNQCSDSSSRTRVKNFIGKYTHALPFGIGNALKSVGVASF